MKINNVIIGSVINKDAEEYTNVKVYISDPWYVASQSEIRHLSIVPDAASKYIGYRKPYRWKVRRNLLIFFKFLANG